MTDLIMQIIKLELHSIKLKRQLIQEYSGEDSAVSQIIVQDSRAAIRQSQETIQFFSKL